MNPIAAANEGNEIPWFQPVLVHVIFYRRHGIREIERIMLALPSLYQRDKHIKAISLRSIALCGHQVRDFLENAAVVTLGVLFGLHVFPLTGRTLVPIAGMMVGNSMTATVLAGRRLTDELRDKCDEVEARLALGQPSRQAAAPYVRSALRAALTPQIETTKATGLVFLPGAMTGLILAGAAPLQAVLVQAVVMFLVLAATATTTTVIALGLIRRLFTADHRLVYLPAPADR